MFTSTLIRLEGEVAMERMIWVAMTVSMVVSVCGFDVRFFSFDDASLLALGADDKPCKDDKNIK